MPDFDEFLARNKTFAASSDLSQLTAMPDNRVFIVTCLDPRVEPAGFLGVGVSDAIVLRNPGGRLSETTIADLALISYMGEAMGLEGDPMEVAVIHHTKCGMGFLANDDFRAGFAARSGISAQELLPRAVTDPDATVRHDVATLLASPLATQRIVVSGHVLDLDTGLVTTVVPATAPESATRTAGQLA